MFKIILCFLLPMFGCKQKETSSSSPSSGAFSPEASQQEEKSISDNESETVGAVDSADSAAEVESKAAASLPPEGHEDVTVESIFIEWGLEGKESYVHSEWGRGDYLAYHICPGAERGEQSLCQSGKSFHQSFSIKNFPSGSVAVKAWICREGEKGASYCGPALLKNFIVPERSISVPDQLLNHKQDLTNRLHEMGGLLKSKIDELNSFAEYCSFSVEQQQLLKELQVLPSGVLAENIAKEYSNLNESLSLSGTPRADASSKVKVEAGRIDSSQDMRSPDSFSKEDSQSVAEQQVTRWSKIKNWLSAYKDQGILLLGGLAVTVAIVRLTEQRSEGEAEVAKATESQVCRSTKGLFLQVKSLLSVIQGVSTELLWVQSEINDCCG